MHDGMAGTKLLRLFNNPHRLRPWLAGNPRFDDMPNLLRLMPNNDRNTVTCHAKRRVDRVQHHRLPRDLMQHFDMVGLHSLAQPGCHYNHSKAGNR